MDNASQHDVAIGPMSYTIPSKNLKRKTLDDYFQAPEKQNLITESICAEKRIPRPPPLYPPGLTILADFVNASEESALLAFLDQQAWRTDLARRTMHYGGTYCLLPPRCATPCERRRIEADIKTALPIPHELQWLVERMVQRDLYQRTARPEFCIVNEYRGAQGISAHVENFRFGEPVCALTLGCGDYVRFHELSSPDDGSVRTGRAAKAKKTGTRLDVWLPGRSLMVMRGEARRCWQHEIVRSRKGRRGEEWRRVSLTFRVERKGNVEAGPLA